MGSDRISTSGRSGRISRRHLASAVALVASSALVGAACVAPPPTDEYAYLDTQVITSVRDPRTATVRIRSTTCQGMGTGSGFLLDANTIVTNRHVVEGATTIEVETYLGEDLVVNGASQCSIADLAADALAVLDAARAARAHWCGVSLGGMVAMWVAAHHPERVQRLVRARTTSWMPPP